MILHCPGGGAGVPCDWTVGAATAAGAAAGRRQVPPGGAGARVNLAAGLIADGVWPVRDQGHRGTCNAFAVVAAEELADFHQTGSLPRYAEEDLYRAMRAVSLADAGLDAGQADAAALARTGATFLAQARVALARGGLVEACGQPYALDPLLPVNHVAPAPDRPRPGVNTALPRRHAIAASSRVRPAIDWGPGLPGSQTLAEIFLEALHRKLPVVAAVPILAVPGADVFTSAEAVQFGRAAYPPAGALRPDHAAIAGHAVCIVGYEPRSADRVDGWFLFRNSHGPWIFGRDAGRDGRTPRAPAPGYGLIAAQDIDRFCWEFLIRA